MAEAKHSWHRDVITPAFEKTLLAVKESSALRGFYLAGGTGLALRLGHRRSEDLDFFTEASVNSELLVQKLQHFSGFSVTSKGSGTLHVLLGSTRVSFLSYEHPLLFPLGELLGVQVADPRDIACMKISAIAGRGTKRDFVDLFVLSRNYALADLLDLFKKKFTRANYNLVHVLKSLTYFEDADKDPMPEVLVPLAWEEVKKFFAREAKRLL